MTASFPDLSGVQRLFWRLITAPRGVREGAASLRREGALASEDLSFLVAEDERLGPCERLDIYADMYFYRLRDCLAEDFPKLAARIGAPRFHNLVTDYLLAHPPRHFSLRELGRALPEFVAAHPLAQEFSGLADLARLEWARVDVFDETDAPTLSRAQLLEEAGADPERAALGLVPCARLLRLDASVLPLWKRLDEAEAEPGGGAEELRGERRGALVWRKGFAIFHRSLRPDEERCLQALAEGTSLAQLGELLAEAQPPEAAPEAAAQRLAGLLDLWARDELLTRGPLAQVAPAAD